MSYVGSSSYDKPLFHAGYSPSDTSSFISRMSSPITHDSISMPANVESYCAPCGKRRSIPDPILIPSHSQEKQVYYKQYSVQYIKKLTKSDYLIPYYTGSGGIPSYMLFNSSLPFSQNIHQVSFQPINPLPTCSPKAFSCPSIRPSFVSSSDCSSLLSSPTDSIRITHSQRQIESSSPKCSLESKYFEEESSKVTSSFQKRGRKMKKSVKGRKWTAKEDSLLRDGVAKYGSKSWNLIAQHVGTGRSQDSCLQRWYRNIDPSIKKGFFTSKDDENIIAAVKKYGYKWSHVAKEIEGRVDISVRNRFKLIVKKGKVPQSLINEAPEGFFD
ncbi:hypothetical protein ADUPG1_000325 [Aduncisulcus paluster]|uniref:Uncharacterized protein n=1 Tax=Aduncisulcus paluster TaxID=2918883 RepID=A0ABQ5K5W5_9EUKA|nr:hypothetical protein ADUPG1_000325 [Aduncisulcus paluster]